MRILRCKQDAYKDDDIKLTPEQLMGYATKSYLIRIQRYTWEQDTADHRELVNMSTQLMEVNKKLEAVTKGENKNQSNKEKRKQRRAKAHGRMKRRPKGKDNDLPQDRDGKTKGKRQKLTSRTRRKNMVVVC
jgi:hypothetical protein